MATIIDVARQYVTVLNVIGLFVAYAIWTVFRELYLSPLRAVPGPFFAKISGNYMLFVELAGNRVKVVHELHKKYGPVVRVGPNELSFNTVEAVDAIYGLQTDFRKAPWYKHMTRGGVFNTRDPVEHRHRRKMLSHAFSPANVADMEPNTDRQIAKLVSVIEERRTKGPIDVRHWMRMLSFDLSGEAFLGKSFGGLDSEKQPPYVADLDSAFIVWDLEGRFPTLTWLAKRLPIASVQHFFTGVDRIYKYGEDCFDDYVKRYGRTPQRKDILTKLIRREDGAGEKGESEGLTDAQIASEISNLTFAATDTAALVMCYLFWELAHHPELQKEMRAELKNVEINEQGLPKAKSLVNLPLLNAAIQETMRKHSPVPAGLFRESPKGGRTVAGTFVPEGTVASMPSWTAHRDPEAFPEPEKFDPHRWLVNSEKASTVTDSGDTTLNEARGGTEAMKTLYMPFTKGTRKCIGQAMAMLNMRITVATLVRKYEVGVSEGMKEEDMDFTDHFLLLPKSEHCNLDFKLVQ